MLPAGSGSSYTVSAPPAAGGSASTVTIVERTTGNKKTSPVFPELARLRRAGATAAAPVRAAVPNAPASPCGTPWGAGRFAAHPFPARIGGNDSAPGPPVGPSTFDDAEMVPSSYKNTARRR
ncbi:hypothetical protein GCM10009731_37340 [Streptomyces globosus]